MICRSWSPSLSWWNRIWVQWLLGSGGSEYAIRNCLGVPTQTCVGSDGFVYVAYKHGSQAVSNKTQHATLLKPFRAGLCNEFVYIFGPFAYLCHSLMIMLLNDSMIPMRTIYLHIYRSNQLLSVEKMTNLSMNDEFENFDNFLQYPLSTPSPLFESTS